MSEEARVYHELPVLTAEEVAKALASGKQNEVSIALLSSANYSADPKTTAALCRKFLDSSDPELRRVAVLSLGHVARLHAANYDFTTDFEAVLDKLKDEDVVVRGTADDALSDMKTCRFAHCIYSRAEMEEQLTSGSLLDRFGAIFAIARWDPDPLYVFRTSLRYLQDPRIPLRVAGIWAIFNPWEHLSTSMKNEARQMVSSLQTDSNDWVRENARRALKDMTDSD